MSAFFCVIKIMEAVVFILTPLIYVFVAFLTQMEKNADTLERNKINERLQMLEYMTKKRVCKMNKLSFKEIDHDYFHLQIDLDTQITRIQLTVSPVEPSVQVVEIDGRNHVKQLHVHDVFGNMHTVTSNCGIFDLENPLHFESIEFMYDVPIIDHSALLCLVYDYHGDAYTIIETKLHRGRHVVSNITKQVVDYEKIRNYFIKCNLSLH